MTAITKVSPDLDFSLQLSLSLELTQSVDVQDTFPLSPSLTAFLHEIRSVIVDGQGFILIQGLPTTEWPVLKSSAIYLAIGTIIGHVLSQNGKGELLGSRSKLMQIGRAHV